MVNKTLLSTQKALEGVSSEITLMLGEFGLYGIPEICY